MTPTSYERFLGLGGQSYRKPNTAAGPPFLPSSFLRAHFFLYIVPPLRDHCATRARPHNSPLRSECSAALRPFGCPFGHPLAAQCPYEGEPLFYTRNLQA